MNYAKHMLHSFMLFWGGLLAPPQPVRVGMLDTGELALVDERGQTQVLSVRTTNIIRATLAAQPPGQPLYTGRLDTTDPVHRELHSLCQVNGLGGA